MSRKNLQVNVRIPDELKKYLAEQAAVNRRSVTAELVYRLEKTRATDEQATQK